MPFVVAECTECGGKLAVDDSQKAAICQFCGKAFIVQDAINQFVTNNVTENKYDNSVTHNYSDGTVVNVYENQNSVSALIERAFMFLEDGDFSRANEYFEKVLDTEPENARAYLGKLMAEVSVKRKEFLKDCPEPFDSNNSYQKIMRYGDESLKTELSGYVEEIKIRNENVRLDNIYTHTVDKMQSAKTVSDYMQVAKEFESIGFYNDSAMLAKECKDKAEEKIKFLKERRELYAKYSMRIVACKESTIGVKEDGKLVFTSKFWGPGWMSKKFNDIVAISVEKGSNTAVRLKSDGRVVSNISTPKWTDIVTISSGYHHSVGLKSDGTVVAEGGNSNGQCNVQCWKNIIAISAGDYHTVGLKSDGTIVAVGNNSEGQCNVSDWTDIVAVAAGCDSTVGLKSDGTVVATGRFGDRVSHWTDIVAVFADYGIYGIKADGTLAEEDTCCALKWTDIVAVSYGRGRGHTVGLKSDGTVVAVGNNDYGQCKVDKWKLFDSINI